MSREDTERGGGVKSRGNTSNSYLSSTSTYPIEDTEAHYWTSWLVPMFVVANVAVFIVVMCINNCPKHLHTRLEGKCVARFLGRFSFEPLKDNPLFGPSSATYLKREFSGSALEADVQISITAFHGSAPWLLLFLGSSLSLALRNAKEGRRNMMLLIEACSFCFLNLQRLERLGALERTKVVDKHQGWRLVTCIWLHAGIIHLLANMLSLVFIGIRLEQQFGFVRIGVVYLLSGFGGSVLSSLFIRNNISVGASGALFGLLGAMLSELITNWSIYTNKAAALLTLLVIIAINLAIGILPHVDNFAHIGGFLSGFLLGFVLLPRPQYGWVERRNVPSGVGVKSKYRAHQYALWLVSVILLIGGFAVALVMLFKGENGNDRCHWCHYLSCVPTSRWKCNDNNL
ncbi:hypothetical protein POTOM_049900 [Populus tomentosa]|uniref:RHOMBOID-like protein n=1 Tax=Populus tomentosa TaxID=118781 RepID=A0A8X7YB26_POPTO|nr:hypothetical protein POTOM_049900 [Populus tomentosa]